MLPFNSYIYTHFRFLFTLHRTHTLTHTNSHTNIPNQELHMRPRLPRFYDKNILQHLFCHLMFHDLTNTTFKLSEDDVLHRNMLE